MISQYFTRPLFAFIFACNLTLTPSAPARQDAPSMKLQSPLRIIVAAALLTLLGACATMTSGAAALAGTWTNSLGTVDNQC